MAAFMNSLLPFVLLFAILRTNIHADDAADQLQVLADALMDADEGQFATIYPKFKELGARGVPLLIGEIDRKLPPDSRDEAKETLAKRQANAAVALLKLDPSSERAWPRLKHSPDPRTRSYLIHRLIPLGVDSKVIVKRLKEEPDVTIRRALLLSLGEFGENELSPEGRTKLLPNLLEMYRTANDPGVHAATEWLLRRWKQEALLKGAEERAMHDGQEEKRLEGIAQLVAKDKEKTPPHWYVNYPSGQTIVVIPGPVEFVMGSPTTETGRKGYESQHKMRIGRTFALAAKPVSVEQYRQFDDDYEPPTADGHSADMPVMGTSWYQAAAYCNWLSLQENLPQDQWCYENKDEETKVKKKYLSLSGYRLPTEAELEYATRAGAVTSRHYGETDELLPKYAWCFTNSHKQAQPMGSLKPNDLGLFDVHGNVFTWCQESYRSYPQVKNGAVIEDCEDELVSEGELAIEPALSRVLRGGSFFTRQVDVRSARRFSFLPTYRLRYFGFRVARTVTR